MLSPVFAGSVIGCFGLAERSTSDPLQHHLDPAAASSVAASKKAPPVSQLWCMCVCEH